MVMMATAIKNRAARVVAFVRRKVEVWFVLMILIILGVLGYGGFRSVENTQEGLCRFSRASADTKETLVNVLARESGRDNSDPAIAELRAAIALERSQLVGYCPT
jgi:hypothetical protein